MFVLLHQIPEKSDEKQFAFGEKKEILIILLALLNPVGLFIWGTSCLRKIIF